MPKSAGRKTSDATLTREREDSVVLRAELADQEDREDCRKARGRELGGEREGGVALDRVAPVGLGGFALAGRITGSHRRDRPHP